MPKFNPQQVGGWIDVISEIIDVTGGIFDGKKDGQILMPPNTFPQNTGVAGANSFGGSNWWDDWFGGGSTVNIFGMEVPRTVIIIAVGYLIFQKQIKRIIR